VRQEVSADLRVDWWVTSGVGRITLAGEIDESSARTLAAVVDACLAEGAARVELDLIAVTFLGAAGVRPLLAAAHRLGPQCVSVTRIRPFHRRVVRLCDEAGWIRLPG
jgi:anti-anti-sigma factor